MILRLFNFFHRNGLRKTLFRILQELKDFLRSNKIKFIKRKQLYMIYDLKICPITFNFVDHIIIAELDRLKHKYDSIVILFIPGDYKRLRLEWQPYEEKINYDLRMNRVYNLLLPIMDLLPSIEGFHFFADRYQAKNFLKRKKKDIVPFDYNISDYGWEKIFRFNTWDTYDQKYKEKIYNLFEVKKIHSDQVKAYLRSINIDPDSDKIITISVRHSPFGELRNSQEYEWKKFADYLMSKNYKVIFINDTEDDKKYIRYINYYIYNEAAINIFLRYGLYSLSFTNCLVSNGIGTILYFSSMPFISFKMAVKEDPITNPKKNSFHWGVEHNSRPKFLGKNQEWVYEKDDFAILKKTFLEYEKKYN